MPLPPKPIDLTTWSIARQRAFDSRYQVDPDSGCWVWTGSLNEYGYARIRLNNRIALAHRLSYVLVNGEPPDETPYLDHICENRACVNPDHLQPVTHQTNQAMTPLRKLRRWYDAAVKEYEANHG